MLPVTCFNGAMRAMWTGTITFGLVNVPVKAYSATENHDLPLHQVHDEDGGRIRYQRRCEVCGKIVAYGDIDKAYIEDDKTIMLTDADLKSLPAERSEEIEIVQFVPSDQIEPMMFDRSYYLAPDSKSHKAYVLLRTALKEADRTAIVKFALRTKTRLGTLRVRDGALVLQSLLWADEVREPDFPGIGDKTKTSDAELAMAHALVEEYSSDFTPEDFEDEYQVQLRELIEEKKKAGQEITVEEKVERAADEGQDAEIVDLMEALQRSIDTRREKTKKPAGKSAAKKKTPAKAPQKKGA